MATIFFDGSEVKNKTGYTIGAGVVCVDGANIRETSFVTTLPISGLAEQVAFAIAAKLHGHLPSATFYTDDEISSMARQALHVGNHLPKERLRVVGHFERLVKHWGKQPLEHYLDLLSRLDIKKVKGHTGVTYNERADYLAKASARCERAVPYDTWVKEPVRYWDSQLDSYAEKTRPFTV